MLYCFILDDLECEDNGALYHIQAKYAEKLGKLCFCDLKNGEILDSKKHKMSIQGEKVFLRSSHNLMPCAMRIMQDNGAVLLENMHDVKLIENWVTLGLHKRIIKSFCKTDIENNSFSTDIDKFLAANDKVFIKSVKKGVSMNCDSVLLRNSNIFRMISPDFDIKGEIFLLSKKYEMARDSLGTKEARFIVIGNKVINQSRYLWGLKHTVPKSLIKEAYSLVERIKQRHFPENYVLDLGFFQSNDEEFIDIVEFNPITPAYCYVNNSIFEKMIPELEKISETVNYGYEYMLDFTVNPSKYHLERKSNILYELSNENRYTLSSE